MARTRSRLARYSPDLVSDLRKEMAKHPNPDFGKTLKHRRMTDGDLLDVSARIACAYFSGELLEPVQKSAAMAIDRQMRRTLLVTAAIFGCTATFQKDGGATLEKIKSEDQGVAAVQALVDCGMSVKDAMACFAGTPEGDKPTEPMHVEMPQPEVVH